ncbi:MAG TPA: sugar ABC transporter permease [Rectinemataceae bacterium]|nr:sugar ABC transporter permease [Rectinemataceae bacterium]
MTKAKRIDREAGRAYWMMSLPAFLVYLLVMAFPIALSVVLSVSNYSGGKMFGGEAWGFAGFGQYARIVQDPWFWNALKNNFYIVLISVFGQLPLGFIFAYIIYRRIVKWPGFWQGILYLPNIISIIVVGLLWQSIFSPNGPIAELVNLSARHQFEIKLVAVLGSQGHLNLGDDALSRIIALGGPQAANMFTNPVPELRDLIAGYQPNQYSQLLNDLTNLFVTRWTPDFLNQKNVAMLPVLFVILWMYTGMYLILFLANMQKIDTQIIESARIDGANEAQVMRHIILPALSGTIVNSAILAISGSLSSFALIFALTGGGPSRITEILSIYMYNNAFLGRPNFPLANAIALITVVISMLLILVTKAFESRYGGKEE